MCGICGCSTNAEDLTDHQLRHDHRDHEDHDHDHHAHIDNLIQVEQDIFANNNQLAKNNEKYFSNHKILTLNIMSSPGSGKTTFLSKTISDLRSEVDIAVIVGDQYTNLDAELIKTSGGHVFQVNTGKTCHLDAHMISHALDELTVNDKSILFIENVGNLVCPASFHLGEKLKVVILSVTEGDNKPLKYPDMFRFADLMIITKTDLLPYVDFSISKCIEYARRINPDIPALSLSVKNNDGLTNWYQWLRKMHT